MEVRIRPAKEGDLPAIVNLCQKHAEYEHADYRENGQTGRLLHAIFSIDPVLFCLVAESEGTLVGYATFMKQYSTWDADWYLYLDCLYLDKCVRGMGVGRALMKNITLEAVSLGCKGMQWQTPDFNEDAVKFYHKIGATSKCKIRFFKQIDQED